MKLKANFFAWILLSLTAIPCSLVAQKDSAAAAKEHQEITILQQRVIQHMEKEEWKEFGEYYKKYFDKILATGKSGLHINNVSWFVFLHVDDKGILKTAEKAMRYNIEKFEPESAISIDTYANILYKLGKKKEAIQWQKKAVSLSDVKDIRDNYDKMLAGKKTW